MHDREESTKSLAHIKKEYERQLKPIKENVERELKPLFADFQKDSLLYKMFLAHAKEIMLNLDRITTFSDLLQDMADTLRRDAVKPPRLRNITFMYALYYMSMVELASTAYVDLTILLLIVKGHHLHLEPDYEHRYIRHVTSLEDLKSPALTLSMKLDFLESNGLIFFSKWIDRNLRNKIAHLDFEIDDSGHFFLIEKGRKSKEVDIRQKLFSSLIYFATMATCLTAQFERFRD